MQSLVDNGTKVIFGYPGGAIMPTYDALFDYRTRLRHVLVRHEQGATHAAQGYARVTGEPGVVMVTSGPGATNAVTGLADALMDSTPLIVISGQVAYPKIGTDAFQEAPVIDIVRPITKWAYQIRPGDNIKAIMDEAFARAKGGRPGPVLIDIPRDVQISQTEYDSASFYRYEQPSLTSDRLEQINQVGRLLSEAQRPYILAGQGVLLSRAERELIALAEKAGIPIANTLLGLTSVPSKHYLNVGMLGMHGRLGANTLTNEADVIMAVGMRFDDRVTGAVDRYARQAQIVHIDIEPKQLDKAKSNGIKVDLSVNLGARTALTALLGRVDPADHFDWLRKFRELDDQEHQMVTSRVLSADNPDLTMDEVIHLLSEQTQGDAIIVPDVGQHQMVTAQRYGTNGSPRSFITSGGMGTMGFALPAAIGAQIGAPERTVVSISGDGSFQMTSQEMMTVSQEGLPLKIVVLNNSYLGMVRQWQELFFNNRESSVSLDNPDFVMMAAASRIPGMRVERRGELHQAVGRMLTTPGPFFLEVAVGKRDNIFPMMPTGAAVDEMRLG